MNFIKISLFVLALFLINLDSVMSQNCQINVSTSKIDFSDVIVGQNVSQTFKITNNGTSKIRVKSIKVVSEKNSFTIDQSEGFFLQAQQERTVTVVANPNQNMELEGAVFVNVSCNENEFSIPIELKAKARYKETYYDNTYNLEGQILKDTLSSMMKRHTKFTYKQARTYMWTVLHVENDKVECVYTGRTLDKPTAIPDVNSTKFNTEHTWPQAFGADNEPPLSDLFHIYPTYEPANSARGNLIFGDVVSNIKYSEGECKLGNDANGKLVFEAPQKHKGNVARSLFYFSITYGNPTDFLNEFESTMKQWYYKDPVDDKERRRNDSIYSFQKNRNPFIDHPEIIDRLYSISGNSDFPSTVNMNLSDTIAYFKNGSNDTLSLYVFNNGNTQAKLIDFSLDNPSAFTFLDANSSPSPIVNSIGQLKFVRLKDNQEANLTVNLSNGVTYKIKLMSGDKSLSVKNIEVNSHLNVFPNPVENNLTISSDDNSIIEEITIYNQTGSLVFHKGNISNNLFDLDLKSNNIFEKVLIIKIKTNQGEFIKNIIRY